VNGDHRRKRRVSGGEDGGNADRPVKKCRNLWRTCGMLISQWKLAVCEEMGVEIFCSTWNRIRGIRGLEECWEGGCSTWNIYGEQPGHKGILTCPKS
jgi:hypothetical protein